VPEPEDLAPAYAIRLRLAGHALARAGLVHAYGHVSVRLDNESFAVTAAKPLGLLAAGDEPVRVPLTGSLPAAVLPEVVMHQQVYRRRPDVEAVVRFQSPQLITLSTLGRTPRARHGFGAYFSPAPPLHDDPRLVRDVDRAGRVADQLGASRAIVLRANGALCVGRSLEEALTLAWYLEDAARVELGVLATGQTGLELTDGEARDRAITTGGLYERMWEWLTRGESIDSSARGPHS